MKYYRIAGSFVALIMLLVCICAPANAAVVSPGDDFYYLDEANVLDTDTEGEIFFSNKLLEEACGAQIVVVALKTTGSTSIDDYAYELFNEWGIGDKDEENGFLLLIAIEDEDYYAVSGTGLDFKFSSGTIGSYLDKYLEPDFAKGDYDRGARLFFEAAFKRIADSYNASVTVDDGISAYKKYASSGLIAENSGGMEPSTRTVYTENRKEGGSGLGLIIIILIIVLIVVSRRKKRARATYVNNHRGSDFVVPFLLGRMSNRPRTTYIPPRNPPRHNGGSGFHFGGFNSGNMFGGARPGGGKPGGFSSGRSGGFGSTGRSSFGSSGRSGFGGARGGGGGTRGGGAGRGRR